MNAAVINKNAKLQRVPEACADTNWSRNTLMKVAAEANAIIRVGRTVRIDMPVLYKYIDTVYKAKRINERSCSFIGFVRTASLEEFHD